MNFFAKYTEITTPESSEQAYNLISVIGKVPTQGRTEI